VPLGITHVAAYRKLGTPAGVFYLAVGERGGFAKTVQASNGMFNKAPSRTREGSFKLAELKRIPKKWAEEVAGKFQGPGPHFLGYIEYDGIKPYAVIDAYYPKDTLPGKSAKGFAYYLEAVVTGHLKKLGVKYIGTGESSGYSITGDRRRQLDLVDLPHGIDQQEDVTIHEWLKGMGRGMSKRFKRSE
jgi:hypothetical protein